MLKIGAQMGSHLVAAAVRKSMSKILPDDDRWQEAYHCNAEAWQDMEKFCEATITLPGAAAPRNRALGVVNQGTGGHHHGRLAP